MAEQEEPAASATEPIAADTGASAVAVALSRSSHAEEVDAEAAAFLRDQRKLVNLQIGNLEEDRALQHRHLALQHRHLVLRHFGDRLRIGLQLLAIAAGLFVVVGLGTMVWQAHEDHGLVVEAFSVPPNLAGDGLTGEVVAARLLDKLNALQAATASERPADTYQNNWGSDIKLQIPQTGLTFGEFEGLLREKFGHASHLTGEVLRTPSGIAITARLGGASPPTFYGAEADIDSLAQKAAEAIYRTSQPYRYAQFLEQNGRLPEAFGVIADIAAHGPETERGWAYFLWGVFDLNGNGDAINARKNILKSLNDPNVGMMAPAFLTNLDVWAGHEEEILYDSKLGMRDIEISKKIYTSGSVINARLTFPAYVDHEHGDFAAAAGEWAAGGRTADYYGSRRANPAMAATDLALAHDPEAARSAIAALEPNDDVSLLPAIASYAEFALPGYQIAVSRQDWPAALADARACDAWLEAQKPTQKLLGLVQPTWVRPLEAIAMARTGDLAGAEALIGTTPLDCYLCVRVRGQIAATKHDWPTAERWFAAAAREAPSIPLAFSEWGDERLARGDLAGAIAEYQIAHRKGPHFADPLKGWGDALTRRQQWSEALAKYDEALKYAPAWPELRQARDTAARLI
ncbi:MAG TPA: hypothetical protein VII73_01980 [Caulobacteraceae bacterium]